MVDERESPSAGWREVYDEMEADPDVEEATHRCLDCGQQCENVLRDVYECEEHGIFRTSASGGDSKVTAEADDAPDESDETAKTDETDETDEVKDRARESVGPA